MNYDWKVSITHAATTVNFENTSFVSISVTGRENGILQCRNHPTDTTIVY